MRRGLIAAGMLLLTALTVVWLTLPSQEAAAQVRMATVELGQIGVVSAITGRVGYQEEMLVYAVLPGRVAEIDVEPGQRVAAGQALMRLESGVTERAASVWAAQEEALLPVQEMNALLAGSVIRAPENATVRQLLTGENEWVAPGTPVAALSSNGQVIRCVAAQKDAQFLQCGMNAVLQVEGEEIAAAEVTQVGPVRAEAASGRLVCDVVLTPKAYLSLPQGAQVDADITLLERSGVPVLPLEAVTERSTVWWVHDGICTEIPVEIVLNDEMHAWVNLPEGIVVAIGEFTDGQRVQEAAE